MFAYNYSFWSPDYLSELCTLLSFSRVTFHLSIKFKFLCFTIFFHSSRLLVFAAKYNFIGLTLCNGILGEKSFRKRKCKAFANKFAGAHNAFCWAAAAIRR